MQTRIKIIKFYADNCNPCRAMSQILKPLYESKRQEGDEIDTIDINVASPANEFEEDLIAKYKVRSIPKFVLINEEKNIEKIIDGSLPQAKFREIYNSVI